MYFIAQNHENTYILYIFLLREMPPSRDMLLLIYGHSVLLLCEYNESAPMCIDVQQGAQDVQRTFVVLVFVVFMFVFGLNFLKTLLEKF